MIPFSTFLVLIVPLTCWGWLGGPKKPQTATIFAPFDRLAVDQYPSPAISISTAGGAAAVAAVTTVGALLYTPDAVQALQTTTVINAAADTITLDSSVFINGFVSGAAINAAKNIILGPLETAKSRLDMGAKEVSLDGLYDGIIPAMVGGVPAAAIFFGTKDVFRDVLRHLNIAPGPATILAVTMAQIPYWLLRNPSEVIKTRVRTGAKASMLDSVMKGEISDLYSGLTVNLLYAMPSDWLKFVFYEFFASSLFGLQEGATVNGFAAIVCGSLGALVAETVATPLDVARTRIMCLTGDDECPVDDMLIPVDYAATTGSSSDVTAVPIKPNPLIVVYDILRQEKLSNLFAGAGPRSARALLDGAVQFYAYETTQNLLHNL